MKMYISTALFVTVSYAALTVVTAADPVVTPAPITPHQSLVRAEVFRRRMLLDLPKRALNRRLDDLHFCYGDGSICEASNNLYNGCEDFEDKQYFQCVCENGWVSTDQA